MTPAEERLLDALIAYRFVIRDQMHTLGVCRDRKYLGDLLRRLRGHNFVGEMKPVRYPDGGRLPAMWYLTAKGAKRVEEYRRLPGGSVPYTKGKPDTKTDRRHRKACVDFHIALVRSAAATEIELDFYYPYYASGGDGVISTRVELPSGQEFRPDAIFGLRQPGASEPDLYTVEYSTYREARDSKTMLKKMEVHRKSLQFGSLAEKLGILRSNRALWVFEEAKGMTAVRERVAEREQFKVAAALFWFAVLDGLQEDFAGSWVNLFGEPVSL